MTEARLLIRQAGHPERELKLQGDLSVGRAFDNALCLDEASVSRYHALIESRPDGYWLQDLGGAGGTLVNGAKLNGSHLLKDGDIIQIGATSLLGFHLNGSAQAKSAAVPAAPSPPPVHHPVEPTPTQTTTEAAAPGITPGYIAAAVGLGLLALSLIAIPVWYFRSGSSGKQKAPTVVSPVPVSTATPGETPTAVETPAETPVPSDSGVDVRSLAQNLAGQISRKSGTSYIFEPEFAAAIRQQAETFRHEFMPDAKPLRLEINRAFSNAGLPELFGYVMALSQSGFRSTGTGVCQSDAAGVGLWRIPPDAARSMLRQDESLAALSATGRDADIAAAYLRNLMLAFDPDDFMYGIACYGAPSGAQGELARRLDERVPDKTARRNFWRMVESGIVSRDAAGKVICFFAAGIVGENPRLFGINSDRLSSLY